MATKTLFLVSVIGCCVGQVLSLTQCKPWVDDLKNIKNLLVESASKYGVSSSGTETDPSATLSRVLYKVHESMSLCNTAMEEIDAYETQKEMQYGVTGLEEVFGKLNADNKAVMDALDTARRHHDELVLRNDGIEQQIHEITDKKSALEATIKQQDATIVTMESFNRNLTAQVKAKIQNSLSSVPSV